MIALKEITLLMCNTFNFDVSTQRQLMHSNTSPHGLWIFGEEFSVHIIHGREIFHVGEKNVHFNHVIDAASCGGEDSTEILE